VSPSKSLGCVIRTVSTNSQEQGVLWNSITFVGVLNAIVNIVAFQEGRRATRVDYWNGVGFKCLCGAT